MSRPAIERLGALHFWRLAIKPGRPVALGQIGGVPLIGLPGNPVAALVTFAVLARPLILKLAGAAALTAAAVSRSAPASPIAKSRGGANIQRRACSANGERGWSPSNTPGTAPASSPRSPRSEGLVIIDEETSDLAPGMIVDFLPFSEVIG